jgi:hypothetical protein
LLVPARRAWADDPVKPAVDFLYECSGYEPTHPFNNPQAMCLDTARGRIYVADTGNNQVVILNSQNGVTVGRFRHWVRDRSGKRIPGEPCGVIPGDQGTTLVTDRLSSTIDVVDGFGESVGYISAVTSALREGERPSPGRMCRDSAGNLYVVEQTTGQVLVFDGAGRLQRTFGGLGRGEGRFEMITDVAVGSDGTAYVLQNLGTPVVQAFDASGHWKAGFGRHTDRPQDFHFPAGLTLDGVGCIWVTDAFAHEVRAYTTAGKFLGAFGGAGRSRGSFYYPSDLAATPETLYVLEKAGGRLQAFRVKRGTE